MVSDGMTGSNPVSPASSSSPASSGAGGISPQHIAQDSSLDGPPGPPDGATVPLEGLSLLQAADLANRGPKWEKSHAEIAEQAKHVCTGKTHKNFGESSLNYYVHGYIVCLFLFFSSFFFFNVCLFALVVHDAFICMLC